MPAHRPLIKFLGPRHLLPEYQRMVEQSLKHEQHPLYSNIGSSQTGKMQGPSEGVSTHQNSAHVHHRQRHEPYHSYESITDLPERFQRKSLAENEISCIELGGEL